MGDSYDPAIELAAALQDVADFWASYNLTSGGSPRYKGARGMFLEGSVYYIGKDYSGMSSGRNGIIPVYSGIGIDAFLNTALNSTYGGTWSNGEVLFFRSNEDVMAAGAAYNELHNSWGSTSLENLYQYWDGGYFQIKDGRVVRPGTDIPFFGSGAQNGGDSPGFWDDNGPLHETMIAINEWNPLAVAVNSIKAYATGTDINGRGVSNGQATFALATILPIGKVAKVGKFLVNPNALSHIFREAVGHVNPTTLTSQSRFMTLFSNVASNPNNLVPTPNAAAAQAGVQTYMQSFNNGQVWVQVRYGYIFNAGVNRIP